MKQWTICTWASAILLGLTACGPSDKSEPSTQTEGASGAASPSVSAPPQAETPPPGPAPTLQAATADLTRNFTASLQQSSDSVLKGLGGDLSDSARKLNEALKSDQGLQGTLQAALDALGGGQDSQAVAFYQKIGQAKLTADQMQAANEVKNLFNAFVVQRNFSTLPGAETQVGKLVQALKQADTAGALTQLNQIATSVQLTPDQKNLLSAVAQQYGPSLKEAGQAVQDGLNGLLNKN